MKYAYVVGRDFSVAGVFEEHGYKVHEGRPPSDRPDLIVFTGGSDWSPHLYGEENEGSYVNEARDSFEIEVYQQFIDIPKAGICRGGQLFTIMNGGKLIQHVPGHGGGSHPVFDRKGKLVTSVLSCHHQAMVPDGTEHTILARAKDGVNEVIWFPVRQELAFQSHPEWGHEPTTNYFFDLIDRLIWRQN